MSTEWEKYRQEQERLRLEAEARAREAERQSGQQQRDTAASARRDQLRRDEIAAGQEHVRQLDHEARNVYPVYSTVEAIKREWEGYGIPITVTPFQTPSVALKKDGTFESNDTEVGWKISYSYDDVVWVGEESWSAGEVSNIQVRNKTKLTNEFSLGLKYETSMNYGDWYIEPEGSRETREKGVKAYFVKGIVQENMGQPGYYRKKAISVASPDSKNAFFDLVNSIVEEFKPGNFLPAANERVRQYIEEHRPPTNQGFFRRWFKKG